MIDVLEHIDDEQEALTRVSAALAPGARLVLSVPTPRYTALLGVEPT